MYIFLKKGFQKAYVENEPFEYKYTNIQFEKDEEESNNKNIQIQPAYPVFDKSSSSFVQLKETDKYVNGNDDNDNDNDNDDNDNDDDDDDFFEEVGDEDDDNDDLDDDDDDKPKQKKSGEIKKLEDNFSKKSIPSMKFMQVKSETKTESKSKGVDSDDSTSST